MQPERIDDAPGATVVGDIGASVDQPDEVTRADIDAIEGLLTEVEQAMSAIDAGTYGQCQTCGEQIADDRLARSPTTRRCGACST